MPFSLENYVHIFGRKKTPRRNFSEARGWGRCQMSDVRGSEVRGQNELPFIIRYSLFSIQYSFAASPPQGSDAAAQAAQVQRAEFRMQITNKRRAVVVRRLLRVWGMIYLTMALYRKVTTCARVQPALGLKVVALVPPVMPSAFAHSTAL